MSRYFLKLYFEITGQLKAQISTQLENFTLSLQKNFYQGLELKRASSWGKAFEKLRKAIEEQDSKGKIILFFDEVPWLATKRSNFISALEYFWNSWASRKGNIKLIVCGSASSWMIRNIVNSKGGLHNRITGSIRLLPFSLSETKIFLEHRGLKLNNRQILDLYMVMGGIPHYLKQVQKGLSAAQNINNTCFKKDGFLVTEFDRLYDSLFEDSKDYKRIVNALARSRKGLLRIELLKVLGTSPGGSLNRILTNLEEAGFITSCQPFQRKTKGAIYRLIDEYSYFFLKWIKNVDKSILNDPNSKYWHTQSVTGSWKIWSGYVFEEICKKHSYLIKKALGISGMITREFAWRYSYSKNRESGGAQIDLLFDRNDNVISICEIKCHESKFVINKKYREELRNKIAIFREQTKSKKSIFLVMVTTSGVTRNKYYQEMVENEVTLDDLFIPL